MAVWDVSGILDTCLGFFWMPREIFMTPPQDRQRRQQQWTANRRPAPSYEARSRDCTTQSRRFSTRIAQGCRCKVSPWRIGPQMGAPPQPSRSQRRGRPAMRHHWCTSRPWPLWSGRTTTNSRYNSTIFTIIICQWTTTEAKHFLYLVQIKVIHWGSVKCHVACWIHACCGCWCAAS